MEASGLKKIKVLKEENRRLRQMLTDLSLENPVIKDITEKALKPAFMRELVMHLMTMLWLNLHHTACTRAEQPGQPS
jgi:putative transposase